MAKEETTRTMFELWVDDVTNAYDILLKDLQIEIKKLRTLGMTDEAIMSKIQGDLAEDSGVFQSFKGWIEKSTDNTLAVVAQTESNYVYPGEAVLEWVLEPTAEHCDTCLSNAKLSARTLTEWEMIGLPGAGNTECNGYCRCTLMEK